MASTFHFRKQPIGSNEVSDGQSGAEVRGDEVVGTRTGPKKGYKHEEKIVIEECCPTFREWIAPRGEWTCCQSRISYGVR